MIPRRWRTVSHRPAKVQIIPLIDVMFLLLCFFVYATVNMVVQQGIYVDLASSGTSESLEKKTETIIVSVNEEGEYYLNKKSMNQKRLMKELKRIKESKANTTVVVNADRQATHGQVITLLDMVRRSGVDQAVFAVDPES
jgi:biopolymer transport protein ExbD